MIEAEYDGKAGWYHEPTKKFYPSESLTEAEYDGKKGFYHSESNTFLPLPKQGNVAQKTVAAFGRGAGELLSTASGILGPEGIMSDPSAPKTETELQKQHKEWMERYKHSSDPVFKQNVLKVIKDIEKKFSQNEAWRSDTKEFRDRVHVFLDEKFGAYDPKNQPQGFAESLAYGLVEFIPQAPIYEFVGGPAASAVESSLSAVAAKYGPKVAGEVAKKLPEILSKAGKYATTELAPHAVGQGVGATTTELASGKRGKESLEKGAEFAGASAIFKPFLDGLKGFTKTATKKYEPVAKPYTVKDVPGQEVRPDIKGQLRGEGLKEESSAPSELEARKEIRNAEIQDRIEQLHREMTSPTDAELSAWSKEGKDGVKKNVLKRAEEIERLHDEMKAPIYRTSDIGEQGKDRRSVPRDTPDRRHSSLDGSSEVREENPHIPEVLGVEELPFFEELFRGAEKHAPVKTFFDATRKMAQKVPDYFKNIPVLTRHGLEDESFYLASAKQMQPKIVDDLVAKVLGEHYNDPRAKGVITKWLLKDRLVANHDANKVLLADMKARLEAAQADNVSAEEDILHNTRLLNEGEASKKAEYRTALDEATARRQKNLAEIQELNDKIPAQEQLLKDQLEAHDIEGYRRRLKREWDKNEISIYNDKGEVIDTVPGIKEVSERWKDYINPFMDSLYRETAHLRPESDIGSRGQYGAISGVNIRLIHKDTPIGGTRKKGKYENTTTYEDSSLLPSKGSAQATAGDWSKRAKGTGEYTTWLEKNLMASLDRYNTSAAKERFFKKAEKQGVLQFGPNRPDIVLPDGVEWVHLMDGKVERPQVNTTTGKTEFVGKTAWVRSDARQEIRNVLDLDPHHKANWFLSAATTVQLKQLADFVVHGKNLLSEVTRSQGKGTYKDLISKLPIIGQVDAADSIGNVFKEINADTPKIRAEIAELAKLGVLRSEHGAEDIIPTAHLLWKIDTGSRVLMNRYYKRLVKRGLAEDSVSAQRNFILQVGQYNDRLMNTFKKRVRRAGLSPFLVAGETFNRQAYRTLVSGFSGVKGKDEAGSDYMTSVNTAGTMIAATIPMMINYATTGSVLGRPGTKLFSVDLGLPQREDGSIDQVDLGQLTGHRRAMRLLGLDALSEAVRGGQTIGQGASKMALDSMRSIAHPYTGPGAQMAAEVAGMLATGPTKEKTVKALEKLNPAFSYLGKPQYGALESGSLAKSDGKQTADSRTARFFDTLLKSPMGAFGYKRVKPTMSAMELTVMEKRARGAAQSQESMQNHRARQLADASYKKGGNNMMRETLRSLFSSGQIKNKETAEAIWRDRKLSELQRGFKSLSPESALEAYENGSPIEKAKTYNILKKKILNYEGKHQDFKKWFEKVQEAKDELLKFLDEKIVSYSDVYQPEER